MAKYTIGNLIRVSAAFTNQAGVDVDPGQVRVKVRDPRHAITTYVYLTDAAVVRDAAGKYHLDVALTKPGDWHIRFEGKTSNVGAGEKIVTALETPFYGSSGAEIA